MKDYLDQKLTAMLQDVLVPEGLAERLLERLDREEQKTKAIKSRPRVATTGRGFMLLGGVFATALGLLVAVWLGTGTTDKVSKQYVLNEAIRLFDAGTDHPGVLLAEKPVPADYPFSKAVLPVWGTKWRRIDEFSGGQGVVFDLPGPAGAGAALYVVDVETVEGLEADPTLHPFSTAGCCASAWRENGMLYVLVVKGDPATYRTYLNLPQRPVA